MTEKGGTTQTGFGTEFGFALCGAHEPQNSLYLADIVSKAQREGYFDRD